MEQEEKELLLKDICARFPYGVKCQITDTNDESFVRSGKLLEIKDINADAKGTTFLFFNEHVPCYSDITEIKPYLHPMSSMTEEEKEEIAVIRDRDFQSVRKWIHDESIKETGNICPITCGEIDYCNKKHFDYRGLIEKGLAIEAPEGMYK